MQAWLAPGARIPLVFDETKVIFTAGPTTYDLSVHADSPEFERTVGPDDPVGETTVGSVQLTRSEERRVGKECRSRWSAEAEKKKEEKRQIRGRARRYSKRQRI